MGKSLTLFACLIVQVSAPYIAKAQDKGAELLKLADDRVSDGVQGLVSDLPGRNRLLCRPV